MPAPPAELAPYLERLDALPFVRGARVTATEPAGGLDYELELRTPDGKRNIYVELKKSHLSRATVQQVLALRERARPKKETVLLLAPAIGQELGDLLEREQISFIDLAGNCYLDLGGRYVARIQGRSRPAADVSGKGLRAPAYRALFALLAQPTLAAEAVRTLAEAAGVSRQAAFDLRKRLLHLGVLLETERTIRWVPGKQKDALDLFVTGYFTTLRPRLTLGRFRGADSFAEAIEQRVSDLIRANDTLRWGGGGAAERLTGHYRGSTTILHAEALPKDLGRTLRVVPDRMGPIHVVAYPGPLGRRGETAETAHPLLVYAELLFEQNERAREAAAEIAERWLGEERYR